ASAREGDAVTRCVVNADFADAVANGFDVAEETVGDAVQAGGDQGLRFRIAEGALPFAKCVRLPDQDRHEGCNFNITIPGDQGPARSGPIPCRSLICPPSKTAYIGGMIFLPLFSFFENWIQPFARRDDLRPPQGLFAF